MPTNRRAAGPVPAARDRQQRAPAAAPTGHRQVHDGPDVQLRARIL